MTLMAMDWQIAVPSVRGLLLAAASGVAFAVNAVIHRWYSGALTLPGTMVLAIARYLLDGPGGLLRRRVRWADGHGQRNHRG